MSGEDESTTVLIDTHTHLDDEQFDAERDAVIQRARTAGVAGIIAVGTTVDSSVRCIQLAQEYPLVSAAVGLQPNYCSDATDDAWERIVQLSRDPQVVALGETGLDRYWDFTPFAVQEDYFDRHIRLSQDRDLPFIVHMRDCEQDILRMLSEAHRRGPLRGVMHSFTGTRETADRCIELGLHISFAGMVTFKKSDDLRCVAAAIPDDRLLIETDCPYLSPHPKRGQRPNEPALLVHTAACLAEVRGIELLQLASLTTENANRLFGLR